MAETPISAVNLDNEYIIVIIELNLKSYTQKGGDPDEKAV